MWVLAKLSVALNLDKPSQGVQLGFWLWISLWFVPLICKANWEERPRELVVLSGIRTGMGMLAAGGFLVWWQKNN